MSILVTAYQQRYQDEAASERDAQVLLTPANRLFVQVPDIGWVAIGRTLPLDILAPQVEAGEVDAEQTLEEETPHEDESKTASNLLRDLLKEGPRSLGELTKSFVQRAEGQYRSSSVGPMLGYLPDVVRVAPGMYALRSYLETFDPLRAAPEAMLDAGQCRLYVMARYAGEETGAYPFWTSGMERAWCRWAEERDRETGSLEAKLLLESLLAVAQPETWGAADKAHWIEQKRLRGRYAFEAERPEPLCKALPDLQHVHRALIYLQARGSINWVASNRLAQRRVESADGASLLAILLAMGAIQPAAHWQVRHLAGTEQGVWLDALSKAQASQDTVIDWSSAVGRKILDTLENTSDGKSLGWLPVKELNELCDGLRHFEAAQGQDVKLLEEQAEEVDMLMAVFKHNRRHDRLGELFERVSILDEFSEEQV